MPRAPGASPTSLPAFTSSSSGSCLISAFFFFFFFFPSFSSSSSLESPACVLNRSTSSESDSPSSSSSIAPFVTFSSHCDVDVVCLPLASRRSSASSKDITRRFATGRKLYHCSIGIAHTSVVLACIMRRKKLPRPALSRAPLNCTRPPFLLSLTSWRFGSRPVTSLL